ncbi:MAG: NADP-dependent malic enzyme [Candidatus Competibacteraceae bacterium]|nr:NADP-dependent malic enzyme [Candidatus Competibacteraceae bacterium]
MTDEFDQDALHYHRQPQPGKLAIVPTKPMDTQRDLALAYSPGVAAACHAIVQNPLESYTVTARQNLVGVISNGTAVLGLGNIGPLASKPVMEGKAVLFKKFANLDVFDIEIDESDPEEFIKTVARLEPTFGGINLEDIKAPECFIIEAALREKMNIPVFHDDQHGTAIIVAAAIRNGLKVVGKNIGQVKLVASGAGAAALACLNLLVEMGLPRENITVCDIEGVVYKGRESLMDPWKAVYAQETQARTLAEVIQGADIFLGLSAPGVLKPELVKKMGPKPLIMALANPIPEIMPDLARQARPDAIIGTGRSDFPNQVNNVLCFPFIFRGALDVGATGINEEMKLAAVKAIADLAMAAPSDLVTKAYGGKPLRFGPEYLIPKPFDPRLILQIAPAVAKAAMASGVATRPIEDMEAYVQQLTHFVFQSGLVMKPVFDKARQDPKRLVFAEGEEQRILQAVQQVIDDGIAKPILVGRPAVVERRLEQLGLHIRPGRDFEMINILKDDRFNAYWNDYHGLVGRRGISPKRAQTVVRTDPSVVAALMVVRGEADAMLSGTVGPFRHHLQTVRDVLGKAPGVRDLSTISTLVLPSGPLFICDTHVTPDPGVEEIVEMTLLAAAEVQRFGLKPKVALLSRSNFGTHDSESSLKMRQALALLHQRAPDLEVEGEMHGDTALSQAMRAEVFPASRLVDSANLLVMPNGDAAHIAYSLLKVLGGGVTVGPILVGAAYPAHVLTQSVSVRGIINMAALTVTQAQLRAERRMG